MKLIDQWKGKPVMRKTALERFLSTGGLPPRQHYDAGSWHEIGEFGDIALASWAQQWGDLFSFTITPSLDNEEQGALLAASQAESKWAHHERRAI